MVNSLVLEPERKSVEIFFNRRWIASWLVMLKRDVKFIALYILDVCFFCSHNSVFQAQQGVFVYNCKEIVIDLHKQRLVLVKQSLLTFTSKKSQSITITWPLQSFLGYLTVLKLCVWRHHGFSSNPQLMKVIPVCLCLNTKLKRKDWNIISSRQSNTSYCVKHNRNNIYGFL